MAIQEGLVLNGLNLNPATGNFALEALDLTPPPKKPEWAQAADADGADLVRRPLFENRTITATIRITPQASMNLALEKLGELVDQLQEAEKNPGGIPLEWTPANSTKTITFYVLTGAVTGIPIVVEGTGAGYFANTPQIITSMICRPFGYGAELEVAAAKANEAGLSVVTLAVGAVAGDVPAEGRLVVSDTAAVGRRFVEWGLENRYYDAATKLILDSEDMTPVGGVQSTALNASGAYKRSGATKGTIATQLFPEPTICCTTGNLKHVGTFRVKARINCLLPGVGDLSNDFIRLTWQDGAGPFRANTWVNPTAEGLCEVDLGIVTVTPTVSGTQKWLGCIEGYSLNGASKDTLHVDYLTLIPVLEGYGLARGATPTTADTLLAFDDLTSGTLSGPLGARTAELGGAWITAGAATDWTVAAGIVTRATKSDASRRLGVVGPALANMVTAVTIHNLGVETYGGALARYVSSTSYAFCELQPLTLYRANSLVLGRLVVGVLVAGTETIIRQVALFAAYNGNPDLTSPIVLQLVVTGEAIAAAATQSGKRIAIAQGSHASLATAGTLAIGNGGLLDHSNTATAHTRVYSSIAVSQVSLIPYCVQPSQSMEVRSDSAICEDSSGVFTGPVPQYRGSRFYLPQAGSAARTSRIIVKADRNDLEESDQQTIGDSFTAQVFATPRYHVIPR
jgi:hypothetical protein